VSEALDVLQGKEEGKSIKDIRTMIDERYGLGKYAPGTPTPPVS
jgi:hypothetical protein